MIFVVAPDGTMTQHTVDLVEDMWFDYVRSRQNLTLAERTGDALRVKQAIRFSVYSLCNVVAAAVNRWCSNLLRAEGKAVEVVDAFLAENSIASRLRSFGQRLADIEFPERYLENLRAWYSDLMDLRPRHEVEVYEALAYADAIEAMNAVASWLEAAGKAVGQPLQSNTKAAGRSFAAKIGSIISESNAAFDVLRSGETGGEQLAGEHENWDDLTPPVSPPRGT
jgi:hypothetical protein